MKIFNLILAACFVAFALLQFNDDPDDVWYWVLIYGYVAVISAFAAFNRYNMWVIVIGIGAVVYELFRKFPAFAQWMSDGMPSIVEKMEASSPYVELVREFLGLLISLAALIYHYVRYTKWRRTLESSSDQII